jgi:hypothetical protein
MTWRTSCGTRILDPAEAKLFAEAVAVMVEMYKDWPEDGLNHGDPLTVGPFERLTSEQKLTVLEEVAEALLTETPLPPLRVVTENAIYYVFCYISAQFGRPCSQGEFVWGQLVLDALGRTGSPCSEEGSGSDDDDDDFEEEEDEDTDPYIGCLDPKKWENAIEELADRILWDRDFELEDEVGGPIPSQTMAAMDIQEGYLSSGRVTPRQGAADRLEALVLRFCNPPPESVTIVVGGREFVFS